MKHHHDHKHRKGLVLMHILTGLAFALLAGFIFGYFVMLLWNWLMPDIFGLTVISFWQAVGLVLLSRLLVGSFGHRHGHGPGRHGRHHRQHHHHKFHAHWKSDNCCDKSDSKLYEEWWDTEGKQALQKYIDSSKEA